VTELDIYREAEQQSKVVSLYSRGAKLSEIMRETGCTKTQVDRMLADYKEFALQDRYLREAARETLIKTREHYDDIIQQMYRAVEEADMNGDYKAKMSGLTGIAGIEKQRVDFMQRAGMLIDNELGQQIVDAEKKHEIIIGILRDIAKKYPNIGLEISTQLSKATGIIEGVPSERV
jgi:hypothetical protein